MLEDLYIIKAFISNFKFVFIYIAHLKIAKSWTIDKIYNKDKPRIHDKISQSIKS